MLFTVLDSCLFSPLVEESFKLFMLAKILPKKKNKENLKKIGSKISVGNMTENVPQEALDSVGNAKEHSLRSYMVVMICVSIGLKVADNIKRIVLYTHANQKHRMFFAIARSFFPGSKFEFEFEFEFEIQKSSKLMINSYITLICIVLYIESFSLNFYCLYSKGIYFSFSL